MDTAEKASPSRDWSLLPSDLLVDVMVALEAPADLVRSGAVCSSWHAAYTVVRRLRIESPPCLFYTRADDGDPDAATIYNPSRRTSFTVRLPELRRLSLHGSAHGWLVAADHVANLHLVNPLTGAQLALPPITTLHLTEAAAAPDEQGNTMYIVRPNKWSDPRLYTARDLRLLMYLRAVPSCSPSSTGSQCVVLLLHYPDGQLSFACLGDEVWTKIGDAEENFRTFDEMWFSYGYCDAVYNNKDELFYVLRSGGEMITLDLKGDSPVMKRKLVMFHKDTPTNIYLIMAPWGDLLQVWRMTDPPIEDEYIDSEDPCLVLRTSEIRLYKVDIEGQELVRMASLGEYALFLGFNSSMILSTKDFPMLKSDCAYLTHDNHKDICLCTYRRKGIGMWNFRSGTLEDVDHDNVHSWQNWPVPIWFTPSLS